MFNLISLGLVLVAALIILIGAVIGVIAGLKKTIASFVAVVLSFVVALAATLIICSPEIGILASIVDAVKGYIPLDAISEITEIAGIDNLLVYYASMILSPFVFLVIFLVALLILWIISLIVARFIAKGKDFSKVGKRLGGLGLGAVCGILVSMLVLMPFVGLLDIGAKVGESEKLGPDLVGEDISSLLSEASDDVTLKFLEIYCGWIYDGLSSAKFKGDTVSLEDDAVALIGILSEISNLSAGEEGFGEKQIDSMNNIIDSLDKSPMLRDTIASVLSNMASKWLDGEEFMGISKIDGGELLNPVIDRILGVIAESNKDNISQDMKTLTGILALFVEHDMFEHSGDYKELLRILGGEGVIAELIEVANANPRMSFISDEITKLSVRALSSTIGIPEDEGERYNLLMDEIAAALNHSRDLSDEERLKVVEADIAEALLNYGVEAEGQASMDIAGSIIKDLGDLENVSGSDVSEFFMIYAIADRNADVNSGENSDYELLSDGELTFVTNPDGTISINGVVLKNYRYDNYVESEAYRLGNKHVDIGDAATLYSAESMKSSLITLSDILENVKLYSECDDPNAAAEKISEMIIFAAEKFDLEGGLTTAQLVNNLGELLDLMQGCELFGSQATADMVKAIFQSKDIRGEIGLSYAEIGNFADKLNETASGENGSYASTTQSISQTLDVIDKINDPSTDDDERIEATQGLISNMTPENAELLSTMTKPSMMEKYGAPAEKAESVSNSVSSLFENMANYAEKSGHEPGSQEYINESTAVNTLLNLAINSTDSTENSLFASEDGSKGRTGLSADDFVDLLVSSEVVSETLLTTASGDAEDPFGIVPSAEDEEVLSEALVSYYNDAIENDPNVNKGELISKLDAIAVVVNIATPTFD